jgi:hypothetical protein
MSKSMKALVFAGVLSLAAASAVQAGGNPTGHGGEWHTGRGHTSVAPACDTDQCPVLAGDGPPIGAGDKNGRSSAALSQGGGEFLVAGGRVGGCGDISR